MSPSYRTLEFNGKWRETAYRLCSWGQRCFCDTGVLFRDTSRTATELHAQTDGGVADSESVDAGCGVAP